MKETLENSWGFVTKDGCYETMLQLRSWAGLQEISLEKEELAAKQGLGFTDGLKCRWMRRNPKWTQKQWIKQTKICLDTIESQRSALGLGFDDAEWAELNEQRYTYPTTLEPFNAYERWNNDLFEADENGQYIKLKAWLDQGGDVTLTDP